MAEAGFSASSKVASSEANVNDTSTAFTMGSVYGGGFNFGAAPSSGFEFPSLDNLTTKQMLIYGGVALLALIFILRR